MPLSRMRRPRPLMAQWVCGTGEDSRGDGVRFLIGVLRVGGGESRLRRGRIGQFGPHYLHHVGAGQPGASAGDKEKGQQPSAANAGLLNFRFVISLSLRKPLEPPDLGVLVFHEYANCRKIGGVIVPVVVPHYSPGIE